MVGRAAARGSPSRPPPTAPVARAFCSTWTPARLRARACPLVATTTNHHMPCNATGDGGWSRAEQGMDPSSKRSSDGNSDKEYPADFVYPIQSNETFRMPPGTGFFFLANVRTAQLLRLPNNCLAAVLELPSKFKTNKINKLFPSEKK